MSETNPPAPPPQPSTPESPPAFPREPQQEPLEQLVAKAFVGSQGIRAGWRLTIFVVIAIALITLLTLGLLAITRQKIPVGLIDPKSSLIVEASQFFAVFLASLIMAKMEKRCFADYGLPLRGAFGVRFWQGMAFGFVSITALLVLMRLAGVFSFGTIGLHGVEALKYGLAWGLVFLFVGFFEEFFVRGYPLFTLTTGMTFWPSAIVLCIIFGLGHRGNSGESWVGVLTAGGAGLLFSFMLRRTGDLWMPIGFHAAWDWGQSYFYGVADSGQVSQGHLFNSSVSGPTWLSGGTVGPEGSWLCVVFLVILGVIVALWLPEAKYPNPEAIHFPREVAEDLSLKL